MKKWIFIIIFLNACSSSQKIKKETSKVETSIPPNIILLMADDLGWGDTGYNGHPEIKTPNLDKMAANGLIFERFYAAAPVCSPTRGSCLTGRNPFRYGIFQANVGHLLAEEITLAELLKAEGYHTGHFGKWHLGTLTKEQKDANRGGQSKFEEDYSPPWQHGFEVCFSTESKVPTWNPMLTPEKAAGGVGNQGLGNYFGTAYWNEKGERIMDKLEGDDSRVIMDRAIPFLEEAVKSKTPFLAVIWFHTPHTPVVGGKEYLEKYSHLPKNQQHYYACISAMDEQIGRLREKLKSLGVYENTLTFFTSDNGPENNRNRPRSVGSTKGLSERKRGLKEGGIRVPGLAEFPNRFPKAKIISQPFMTSDYLPTVLDLLGIQYPDKRPLDGTSFIPFLENEKEWKREPLVFRYQKKVAVIDGDFKLYKAKNEQAFALFNLKNDPAEQNDLSKNYPEKAKILQTYWEKWRSSQEASLSRKDYE